MTKRHGQRYLQLGLNIAYYRKLKGLTQMQLSESTNISRTHMSNIEASGVMKPVSLNVLFDIAEVLGIEPGKLLEMRE